MKSTEKLKVTWEKQKRRWEEDHQPKIDQKAKVVRDLEAKVARYSLSLEKARADLKAEQEKTFRTFQDYCQEAENNHKKRKKESSET